MRKLVSGLVPVVVVACLFAVVGVSPATAQGPKNKARGTLEVVCVDRGDGSLRAPSGSCARGEDRVQVSVAERLRVRRGLVVPNNEGAWFCAAPGNGALREIERPNQCRKGSALESRNHRPGEPELSDAEVPENVPVGTAVGTLTADDKDDADRMTYRLVGGDTDTFAVVDGALVTAARLDFEARASYRVRVQVTDVLGLARVASLDITVVDAQENRAPTDLSLGGSSVEENEPAGTLVGRLGTTDADAGDAHTYTLVTEAGVGNDNPLFSIAGDELRTVAPLDFEEREQLVVRVRTDDGAGGSLEKNLAVSVADAPDAPAGIGLSPSAIDENRAGAVGRLTASDQDDSERHTFSLVAGAGDRDNATFAISGDQLTVVAPADFEQRSSLTARVRVTDKDGLTYDQAVSVSVTDAAEAPTRISLSPASVHENEPAGTTVGTLTVSDPDGAGVASFALVAGPGADDNADFRIQGSSLVTDETFDYEADASRTVRVRGTDTSGASVESVLSVAVVNENEPATRLDLSGTTVDEDAEIGTVVGTLSTDDPDLDDPITYALLDDAGGRFAVDGDELATADELDSAVATSHTVEVRAEDAGGESVDATFVISVGNVNEAPTAPGINDDTIDENLAAGAAVGELTATDPDAGDTVTFALVPGQGDDHNAAFQVSGTTLVTADRFDHEARSTYSIRVRVTDSGVPALSTEGVLTIHVADVNEAPSAPSLSPASVAENQAPGTRVGTLSASDPDTGQTLTYTLEDELDGDHFQVVAGAVYALDTFDFEDRDSYEIRVGVADGHGGTSDETLTITVTDANDAPASVSLADADVDENTAAGAIGTLSTTDEDAGDSHTYTLPDDEADNDDFVVVGDVLRAAGPFDHETRPTLDVLVRSTDEGGAYVERTFTITVDDLNEAPTAVSLSNDEVDENVATQTVGTLSASDPEGGTMTYALVSGAGDDNGSFQIDGTTLRATAAFDHETQPTLSVRVRVTDSGGLGHVQVLTIDVVDLDDLPTGLNFRSGGSVAENQAAGTEVGVLDIVDADGQDPVEYSVVDGAGKFTVSETGEVTTTGGLDFETTPEVTIRVAVSDGDVTTYTGDLVVTVTNRNESPSRVDLSATSVNENKPAGTVVGALSAVDPDAESADPTFELVQGDAEFEIDGDELVTREPFDHETTASYTIRVRATDAGGESVETSMTITVGQVNEAPSVTQPTSLSVAENRPAATTVGTITGTDPESDALTWTLVSGTGSGDNAKFAITSAGVLKTAAGFDFEIQDEMHVRVRVSDGALSAERALTVDVLDVNDAPTPADDSFTGAIGNTAGRAGAATSPGSAATTTLVGELPMVNDTDQDGDALAVVSQTGVVTSLGGTVDLDAEGNFMYYPPAGVKNQTDTFVYNVRDGDGATGAATVSVTIANRRVWYVGSIGLPGTPNGTSRLPYASFTSLNGPNDVDGAGDDLFVYTNVNGPIALEQDQRLLGATAGLPGVNLVGVPNQPQVTAVGYAVALANGSSVDGVSMFSGGSGEVVRANSVSSATIGSKASIGQAGTGTAVSITGVASGNITIDTAISISSGRAVTVSDRLGGTVTFAKRVSASPHATAGVSLTNNVGATIAFPAGVGLSVSGPAFTASGGGIVTVAPGELGSTLKSTAGTALTVTDTTIGASGLTFQRVDSTGGVNGILLRNTGTSGSLTVTGSSSGVCGGKVTAAGALDQNPDPLDCTGGTISGATGSGIVLDRTKAPSLTRVYVTAAADDGITVRNVTGGLTLAHVFAFNNGDAAGDNAVELGDPDSSSSQGVTGTVSITDSHLGSSPDTQLYSGTSSGSTTLSLLRNRVFGKVAAPSGAMDGVRVQATSGGTVDLTQASSYFASSKGDAVQVTSSGSGVVTRAAITSNTVTNSAGIGRGIQVAAGGSPFTGTLAFDVAANSIQGIAGPAVAVLGSNVNGTRYVGHVRHNTIGQSGTAGSCASAGDGILVSTEDGAGAVTAGITSNSVRSCAGRGITVEANGGAAAVNATITGNTVNLQGTPGGAEALRLDLNPQVTDTGTSCVQIATNTLLAGPSSASGVALRLNHVYGTLQAVTSGLGNLGDTYETRLSSANTVTGGVLAFRPATSTHTGVSTCPTAPN